MDCSKVTPVDHCECPILEGGWCDPHQIYKTPHYVKLCRTKPKYREAWNACRGPLQNLEEKHDDPLRKRVSYGPGTELRRCLGCSGARMSKVDFKMMDQWGVEGCREHHEEIVGWLLESKLPMRAATRLLEVSLSRSAEANNPASDL